MSSDPKAPYGYFPGTTRRRMSPPQEHHGERGTCKYCGEKDLIWERRGERWYLTDVGGTRHECKVLDKSDNPN